MTEKGEANRRYRENFDAAFRPSLEDQLRDEINRRLVEECGRTRIWDVILEQSAYGYDYRRNYSRVFRDTDRTIEPEGYTSDGTPIYRPIYTTVLEVID